MTRPDPLRDELSDVVKAELSAKFRSMRSTMLPYDPDDQRWRNRVWNIRDYRLP